MGLVGDLITAVEKAIALKGWWIGRRNPIMLLPRRVLHVFEAHEVERTQIPRLLTIESGVSLQDLVSEDSFLAKIDEPLLAYVSSSV
jgi:hypothetical protein